MLNKLLLQGRLTADIETKSTQSGTVFSEFTIAWSEKIKENENKCFMRCKAWGNTATFLEQYFSKGKQLIVEGQMRTEQWTDKEGKNQSRTICNVEKVHFCESSKQNQDRPKTLTNPAEYEEISVDVEGELPF